jgi:hypothetical protein
VQTYRYPSFATTWTNIALVKFHQPEQFQSLIILQQRRREISGLAFSLNRQLMFATMRSNPQAGLDKPLYSDFNPCLRFESFQFKKHAC